MPAGRGFPSYVCTAQAPVLAEQLLLVDEAQPKGWPSGAGHHAAAEHLQTGKVSQEMLRYAKIYMLLYVSIYIYMLVYIYIYVSIYIC